MARRKIGSFIPLLFLVTFSQCQSTKHDYDFGLFDKTAVEKLASAVKHDDTPEIEGFLQKKPSLIDLPEPLYGQSLLFLALSSGKEKAVLALLRNGASPNLKARNGETPMIRLCNVSTLLKNPELLLKNMIDHGADLNYVQHDTSVNFYGERNDFSTEPLGAALIYGKPSLIPILVENGADYSSGKNDQSILATTTISMKLDAILYLIQKGAPIPEWVVIRQPNSDHPKKMTITDLLNEQKFGDEPTKRQLKQHIINELEKRGLK